jgi:hypothetical protein
MKSRFLIFTSLVLAVLCLGSASNAMAQSVTGGGQTDTFGGHFYLAVSAHIGTSGPQGTILFGEKGDHLAATVVDFCIFGNRATIIGQVTRSTFDFSPVGSYVVLFVNDNGNSGDLALPVPVGPTQPPCLDFGPLPPFLVITGNITVTP